jgi:hypothetical protein
MPPSGNFSNFTKVGNCSCAACDAACPAPPVDASIGFFDGFDGILVAIVYGGLIVFSIVFQLIRAKLMGDKGETLEYNEDDQLARLNSNDEFRERKTKGPNINDS